MRGQTHHTVPTNKGPVAFLGMGVTKGNSRRLGREVVNKLGLAFLLPPTREMTPRSGHGINSTHRRAWAAQHGRTGHKPAWFMGWYEDSSDLINGALGVKDDCRTPSPGLQQHRITAQESSQAGKRGCPWGPPNYTTTLHRCLVYRSQYSDNFWLAVWKGYNEGERHQWSINEGSTHLTSNHGTQRRPLITSLQWCWAREAQQHKTIDVPNWVPLGHRNSMGRNGR